MVGEVPYVLNRQGSAIKKKKKKIDISAKKKKKLNKIGKKMVEETIVATKVSNRKDALLVGLSQSKQNCPFRSPIFWKNCPVVTFKVNM